MSTTAISERQRSRIRRDAGNRCGYCLAHQDYIPWTLEIEHIIPLAAGGKSDDSNLWLACHACNLFKGVKTRGRDPLSGRTMSLFNPRLQRWSRHFEWSADGTLILGRTACGRATVIAINLNNLIAVRVRRHWVMAGWHPPRP